MTMQPEPLSLPSADWSAVPAYILHLVFTHLFAPPLAPMAGLPLPNLVRQWFALAGTCKYWRDALESVPLPVELSAAPGACLAWLAARPVRQLHIASSPAAGMALAVEQLVLEHGLTIDQAAAAVRSCRVHSVQDFQGDEPSRQTYQRARSLCQDPRMANVFPWLAAAAGRGVSLDSMMCQLEGVMDDGSPTQQAAAKTWSLAMWQRLERLHLEGPINWHGDLSFFASASLAALPQLHSLSLACFYGYDLSGLPSSLRRLRLHYEPYLPEQLLGQEMCCSFSLLKLPNTARLDQLVVEKIEGAVAFQWAALSRCCRRLLVHGGLGRDAANPSRLRQVLIGVSLPASETDLWAAVNQQGSQFSRRQRADAQSAATKAWLADFADNPDCLLSEICLGCRSSGERDLLQLVPLAPSTHSGSSSIHSGGSAEPPGRSSHPAALSSAAAKQLQAHHLLAVYRDEGRQRDTDRFPAVHAASALRDAAGSYPGRLVCLERSPPEPQIRPGLLSLVRQLVPLGASPDAQQLA